MPRDKRAYLADIVEVCDAIKTAVGGLDPCIPSTYALTPKLESFVKSKVESGRYTSASEVIREALRLLEEHERIRGERLTEFQAELDCRMARGAQGRSVDSAVVREVPWAWVGYPKPEVPR